ncbi:HET-domain-containing protein [Phaeosphaeriaceae sp. SRC1lsM3a]|nr:HET-domain-containing protein [Stagonospora sp. SRC1lsM3a]
MRLINTSTLMLEEFLGLPPPYAILSHTWEDDEVMFENMQRGTANLHRGFCKVKKCCELAASQNYKYVWIDTCCIDKSSSAELSEAINSMFAYYEKSNICYVYLDVEVTSGLLSAEQLSKARWTYRGWTLQELLAPTEVYFYDKGWNFCGSRAARAHEIAQVTNISSDILGIRPPWTVLNLSNFSIADRMSWMSHRQTTRPEDIAYSLFGIFNVSLTPIYGEGAAKAFRRLQEEILKHSNDLSILAWTLDPESTIADVPLVKGGLAMTSQWFARGRSISVSDTEVEPFVMTNKGLRVELPLIKHPSEPERLVATALLPNCHFQHFPNTVVGIELESFPSRGGNNVWYRRTGFRGKDCTLSDVHPVDKEALSRAELRRIYIGMSYRPSRL